MLCSRCIRVATSAVRFSTQTTQTTQRRSLSLLSSITPTRPALLASRPTSILPAATLDSQLTGLSISQVRGAKRDTFKPSHVVRKRRHGYLSRIKTRTGRHILKRRRAKGRSTLSH
ncbi:hypothetical protein SMMN14_07851 [Sphaerulina musiva]